MTLELYLKGVFLKQFEMPQKYSLFIHLFVILQKTSQYFPFRDKKRQSYQLYCNALHIKPAHSNIILGRNHKSYKFNYHKTDDTIYVFSCTVKPFYSFSSPKKYKSHPKVLRAKYRVLIRCHVIQYFHQMVLSSSFLVLENFAL